MREPIGLVQTFLNPSQNAVLRAEFRSTKDALIQEWEKQTGQSWPVVEIGGKERMADAHHIIPVTNGGPATWWNITPAIPAEHRVLHAPGRPLNQLQNGVR